MEMESDILEVCVDSTESALAAQEGGASRLLCGNLVIGGTSPSPCLFQEVQAAVELACPHTDPSQIWGLLLYRA